MLPCQKQLLSKFSRFSVRGMLNEESLAKGFCVLLSGILKEISFAQVSIQLVSIKYWRYLIQSSCSSSFLMLLIMDNYGLRSALSLLQRIRKFHLFPTTLNMGGFVLVISCRNSFILSIRHIISNAMKNTRAGFSTQYCIVRLTRLHKI